MTRLETLGWDARCVAQLESDEAHRDSDLVPARVIEERREAFVVAAETGDLLAKPAGRMQHNASSTEEWPAVGDWVLVTPSGDRGRIERLLPRRTALVRKEAGTYMSAQVLASNVDAVLVLMAVNRDFRVRRIERYLTMIWESGALPVVVLSKCDLVDDASHFVEETRAVAVGADVIAISSHTGAGLDDVRVHVRPGRTVALVGSSGVGKSTLTNALLGEELQAVQDIREADSRGRHTTVGRHLLVVPAGGCLIDTPGLRELALWTSEDGFQTAFADVEELAAQCRFADCAHRGEPGCAVDAALDSGALAPDRLASYRKLARELAHAQRKEDKASRMAETKRVKQLNKTYKAAKEKRHRLRDGL